MTKYVLVRGGDNPNRGCCNYVSSVDKDGLHFSHVVDDAITFMEAERSEHFARALLQFQTVDVYSIEEKTVRTFEYVW